MKYFIEYVKKDIENLATDVCHFFTILSIPAIFYSVNLYSFILVIAVIFWFTVLAIRKFKIEPVANSFMLFYFAFYLVQVVSFIWTQNIRHGLSELETSAAIIVFPLLLYTTRPFKPLLTKFTLLLYILTALTACIVCHVSSVVEIVRQGLPLSSIVLSDSFHYVSLSDRIGLHPSYMSLLLIVAIYILFHHIITGKFKLIKVLYLVIVTYLVLFLLMLMARGPLLGFVIALCLTVIFVGNRQKKMSRHLILSLGLVFMLCLIFFKPLYNRFTQQLIELWSNDLDSSSMETNSVSYHLKSWVCAIKSSDSFLTILFGHGLGDEVDTLVNCYKNTGYLDMAAARFNAHNEYLSQLVKNGLIGVLVFILFFFKGINQALKKSNSFLFFFIVVFIVMCLFESLLNVSQGVFFFSFVIIFFEREINLVEMYSVSDEK